MGKGICYVPESFDGPAADVLSSQERSKLRIFRRESGVHNRRGAVFRYCKSSREEHISEVVDCFPEEAFPKHEGDSGVLKKLKERVDVLDMILH